MMPAGNGRHRSCQGLTGIPHQPGMLSRYPCSMQRHATLTPSHQRRSTARLTRQPVSLSRAVARPKPQLPALPLAHAPLTSDTSPYVDYACILTAEGGVLITCKDLDLRLRHTLWRLLAWSVSSGLEGWYLLRHSPVQSPAVNLTLMIVMMIINALIVMKPVEIYRTLDIRPDCMIIDGVDVFWRRFMESGWPALKPDKDGNQVLCGTYGTRFVDYLTVRRFDDNDRSPEVLAANLNYAFQQLWTRQH